MHRSRMGDEVEPGPRMAGEEFRGQQVALEAIAARAGEDEVAGDVRAAVRERMDVVERGVVEIEQRGAVDAPTVAVPHRRVFDGALLMSGRDVLSAR